MNKEMIKNKPKMGARQRLPKEQPASSALGTRHTLDASRVLPPVRSWMFPSGRWGEQNSSWNTPSYGYRGLSGLLCTTASGVPHRRTRQCGLPDVLWNRLWLLGLSAWRAPLTHAQKGFLIKILSNSRLAHRRRREPQGSNRRVPLQSRS